MTEAFSRWYASSYMQVERLADHPIITPDTDPSIGRTIQGPSLIRMPEWIEKPLGRYYLYFADHKGTYIRLAYGNTLTGPWRVHGPGALRLEDSHFPARPPVVPPEAREERGLTGPDALPHDIIYEKVTPHIASPDVHIDDAGRKIIMYFHGLESYGCQRSRAAVSADGIHFKAYPEIIGPSYMRIFRYGDFAYALAMRGQFYRSTDGFTGFTKGPKLFNRDMRHCAVLVRGEELLVFWTQVGETPERILLSRIDIAGPWMEWKESDPEEVLRPERVWEGAQEPLEPSVRSVAYGQVNQLRDPAVFEEGGRIYLLYAVAGESGIAIAEVRL